MDSHYTNIIPHIWKLANIVPIPKPNKDIDKGISYRPISPLSVIAKTLEKSLLPYITTNIPNTSTQHRYKAHHSTVTALHTVNNTVAKGFIQMAPHAPTITVAIDMSKAFDTINIHTLIRKLIQTNIPGTLVKFIANYTKRRKAYTTYINHTSSQRQFKTGVPQSGVLSPTLFNILYTADIPPPRAPVQIMVYADDINKTYIHKVFAWTKQSDTKSRQNNLHSVHTRPCRIYEQSGPKIHNKALFMETHPKVMGLILDPKLTYSTHIHNISVQAHEPLLPQDAQKTQTYNICMTKH